MAARRDPSNSRSQIKSEGLGISFLASMELEKMVVSDLGTTSMIHVNEVSIIIKESNERLNA